MSIKINFLISYLFCSFANASNAFRISEDGLYSKDGKLLNREISTKPTAFSYSLRELAGDGFIIYRDKFLNSSNEQCAMKFKKNKTGEYRASYSICFDEIISIKENKKLPALKLVNFNNVELSNYNDTLTAQGEYVFERKAFPDVVLFDVTQENSKSTNEIHCNYYIKDYNVGVSTDSIRCYRNAVVKNKAYLYGAASPHSKSKEYLVSGDKVIPLDEKVDRYSNKWIYIYYQGKKDFIMWIDSSSLYFGEQVR